MENRLTLPRLSLVTPSYNQAPFLEATLESVLAQNYPALEWIVMDGGSTDGSVEILRRYEKHFAYWTSERDGGQANALQRGFARARGEIFGWLNSDDALLPDALRAVGAHFTEHPACRFLTGDAVFVNADDTHNVFYVRGAAYTFSDLLHFYADKYLPQPAVFFARTLFEQVGGLDESLHYALDLDLWLRMRQRAPLHYLPQGLAKMRMHKAAKGQQRGQPAWRECEQVTRRYWRAVNRAERARIVWGWRQLRARQACGDGLRAVSQGQRRTGWRALYDALRQDPLTLFTRNGRALAARLVMPFLNTAVH